MFSKVNVVIGYFQNIGSYSFWVGKIRIVFQNNICYFFREFFIGRKEIILILGIYCFVMVSFGFFCYYNMVKDVFINKSYCCILFCGIYYVVDYCLQFFDRVINFYCFEINFEVYLFLVLVDEIDE